MEALFTGVNAGIVQTFYTFRILRLSKRNFWLSGSIFLVIVSKTGCGAAWVILSMQLDTYEQLLNISALTITINALSTVVDVSIAVSLCYLLHKARTGFKRSDSIINKLIIFVVNTGMLTTFCAITTLVCLIASPHSLVYATFYFCIGRLYTNSFLATLNARKSLSNNIDDSNNIMMSMSPSVLNPQGTTNGKTQNIAIHIDTSVVKSGSHNDEDNSSHADTK